MADTNQTPDRDPRFPFHAEDAAVARQSWLSAHMTPKAAILAGKLLNLALVAILCIVLVQFGALYRKLGEQKVVVVRINDVGRAEAVRLDADYTPQEPEIRDSLERFVTRFYTRNGFAVPEAIEALPLYLDTPIFDVWRKDMMATLPDIAQGIGLVRVRILNCRIDNPAGAKTTGTTAYIRIATDDMSNTGALIPSSAKGYEVVIKFKMGVYPNIKDGTLRDQWVVRNPLGVKVLDIQRTRYTGQDVDDQNTERVVNKAIESVKSETVVEDTKRKLDAATAAYKEKNNLK